VNKPAVQSEPAGLVGMQFQDGHWTITCVVDSELLPSANVMVNALPRGYEWRRWTESRYNERPAAQLSRRSLRQPGRRFLAICQSEHNARQE
jgi:hypothetical protein